MIDMLSRVRDADAKTKLVAFYTLVHFILEYGCPIFLKSFLNKDIKILQKVQNKALRFISKIKGQKVLSDFVATLTSCP